MSEHSVEVPSHYTTPRLELRCIKYSPGVKPPKIVSKIESYEFEAEKWRDCFESMGGLNALGPIELKKSKTISEEPYHCPSYGREFRPTESNEMTNDPTFPVHQEKAHKTHGKRELVIPRIHNVHLPKVCKETNEFEIPRHLVTGESPQQKPYLPSSAVLVRWGDRVTDNSEVLLDWLDKKFGQILFTIFNGPRSCIVVFNDIRSSYCLLNAGIPLKLLNVSWCDKQLYNFGHLNTMRGYMVSKDQIWLKGIEQMKENGLHTFELFWR